MEIAIEDIIFCAKTTADVFICVFLTLILTCHKPQRRIYRTALLVLMFALLNGIFALFDLPFSILLFPLFGIAVRYFYKSNWIYAACAALIMGIVKYTIFLIDTMAYGIEMTVHLGNIEISLYPLFYLAGGAMIVSLCRTNFTLLPDYAHSLLYDKVRAKRFYHHLYMTLFVLLILLFWSIYLNILVFQMTSMAFCSLAIFTMAVVYILWRSLRQISTDALDQVEASIRQQHYEELQKFMQVIRAQRHDFNFHIGAISGMLDRGQYDECQAYMKTLRENVVKINDVLPLCDNAISAMIDSFREMAAQRNIPMDVTINDPLTDTSCSTYEINTIIGNLLQNAIDEMELHHPKGTIALLITKQNGHHMIKVTNPCSATPEELGKLFDAGFSTKKSHEGIGLATVNRIVLTHHGRIYPELNSNHLSLIVALPVVPLNPDK